MPQTAAEQHAEFLRMYHSTGYVREPVMALDRLLEAVRRETQEACAKAIEEERKRLGAGLDVSYLASVIRKL